MGADEGSRIAHQHDGDYKNRTDEVMAHARRLFDLITPGTTVTINIPLTGEIVVPNQPPEMGQLIITKPELHVTAFFKR